MVLELLFLDELLSGDFRTCSGTSSSLVIFCPFRILNKSASDLGLTVVVVVVLFVGSVLILNKLNRVVDSVVAFVFSLLFISAQGSSADCSLSNSSCMRA